MELIEGAHELIEYRSTALQLVPSITQKMSNPTYEDCPPFIYWREVPHQRSHVSLLRHLQTLSEQGSFIKADGVSGDQGACKYCGRCHYGHEQYNEGYGSRERCSIQSERY